MSAWRKNPFEGPMRDNYAFDNSPGTPDYLDQLEKADLRGAGTPGGAPGGVMPPSSSGEDSIFQTVLVPHAKWTLDQKLAYDLRVPDSAPGQWGGDFSRGFDGDLRSVMEGPAPSGERFGRNIGAAAEFGKGMVGLHSAAQARDDWNKGNYGAAVANGAAAFGQAGLTALSAGTLGAARQAGMSALATNVEEAAVARLAARIDVTDEFILKTAKNGSIKMHYGNPDGVHGLVVNVDRDGILGFNIRASGSRSNPSGQDMFISAMQRLEQENVQVNAIRGTWVEGSDSVNTAEYLANLGKGMAPQQAAASTWTGRMSAKYGYTNIGVPTQSLYEDSTFVLFKKP